MSELALKLIRENIEMHNRGEDATFLDLGNCGMTTVPEEISKCIWVKKLNFSSSRLEYDLDSGTWNYIISSNKDPENIINKLSDSLKKLINLESLTIRSAFNKTWELADISILSGLTNLTVLDLSGTKVYDLTPVSKLINLRVLHFDNTMVGDLSPIRNLTNLEHLDLSGTKIFDLSPISNLFNLKNLRIAKTDISDLVPVEKLSNIEILIFFETKVSDLKPVALLKKLKHLDCDSTGVISLSPISELLELETIDCRNSSISDLSPLKNLINIKHIICYNSLITDLSPICFLSNIEELNIGNNKVTDLTPLSGLNKLTKIHCYSTGITDVSPLENLSNLKFIDCCSTKVCDFSFLRSKIESGISIKWQNWAEHVNEDITNWQERSAVLVKDCPLIIPPTEVAQESPQAVRDYFEELGDDGQKLNEVKVIFLGEASAGKTSLVKRLLGESFDAKESQTHGIRIRKAPFAMNGGDIVTAHFWDFGGQEVMHATHQFFLSQRSVYVLVLNSRNDDQAEKWLKHAASFGGHSPVLVVLNKIDENPSFEVNRKNLAAKYPQIHNFFRISAKTDAGVDAFREALRKEIDVADTRRTPFPKRWLAVKEYFSNMQADYIESAEYRKVCEENGVIRQFSQDVLLQFLHDLGIVINFRNLKNFDTQILNPLWLTNGVYRIINSEMVATEGGLLNEKDFDAVINDPRYNNQNTTERVFMYPKNKLQYIVRVMQEFELCFMLDTSSYVVPQLLPVEEPDFKPVGAMLRFVMHFSDFMPDSIFPRLMVKLHTFIDGNQRWRTGMVLHKPNIFKALARVRWDKEDQKILIDVCGEDRRRLLSFIRETVKEIVSDFTNLNFIEHVPIPDNLEFLEYEALVAAEKAGEKEIFVWQVKKRLPVADLLDGVEEADMRDEYEQLSVKAFISYSHADLEYLKAFRNALSPLIRLNKLQVWDDKSIEAGEEWEKVIFQQLEEADIVLCLVSADFVASDFCYKKEFEIALEAHVKGEKTIVPILLRKTDWVDLPLASIQGVPNEWITSAANKDEAWTKVSESLRPALDRAKQRKKTLLEKQMQVRFQ